MDHKKSHDARSVLMELVAKITGLLGNDPELDSLNVYREPDGTLDISTSRRLVVKNEAECLVTGVVLEPEVTDTQGDIYSADEVFKAAESFLAHCRRAKLQHSIDSEATIAESWTTKNDQEIGGQVVKAGTWLMTMRLPPEEFALVTKGEFTGFSVGCKANTEMLEKSDKPKRRLTDFDFSVEGAEVSLVDRAANKRTILVAKADDNEVEPIDVKKGLEEFLSMMGMYQEQQPTTESDPLKEALENLRLASSSLSEALGINDDEIEDDVGVGSGNTEMGISPNTTPMSNFILEKNMTIKAEDIKKSLESEAGQELVNAMIAKALEEKDARLEKAEEQNQEFKAALDEISKREEARANELLRETVSSYSDLGLEEKDVELFKAIGETGADNLNRFKEILNTAKSALANAEVLDETGVDSLEEDSAVDSESDLPKTIVNKAAELREKDGNLTYEQSIAKALGR